MDLRNRKDLNQRQRSLYKLLVNNLSSPHLPEELSKRLQKINEHNGPVLRSVQDFNDAREDAMVRWIQALPDEKEIAWPKL